MRWRAEITYRTDEGENVVDHYIEEMVDLQGIIERGPDWNTVVNINIQLVRVTHPGLTVEKAETI